MKRLRWCKEMLRKFINGDSRDVFKIITGDEYGSIIMILKQSSRAVSGVKLAKVLRQEFAEFSIPRNKCMRFSLILQVLKQY